MSVPRFSRLRAWQKLKNLYSGGWLLSTRAAAERAAAERAAAERAAGTCVQLSEHELSIIKQLGEKSSDVVKQSHSKYL